MRAREFITEVKTLPPELADPMNHVFVLPGVNSSDPYEIYRFGVAMARARSDAGTDGINAKFPAWDSETAFGEHGVVAGMNGSIAQVIDTALTMTKTPGGKRLVSTPDSTEPTFVDTQSPVKPFKGY